MKRNTSFMIILFITAVIGIYMCHIYLSKSKTSNENIVIKNTILSSNLEELINNTIREHSDKFIFDKSYFLHVTKYYTIDESREFYYRHYQRPELVRLWYPHKVYIRMLENAQK